MLSDLENLFKEEMEELNNAKQRCKESQDVGNVLIEYFDKLISSYEKTLRSMMKLTKISDGQQVYLQQIQEELRKEIEERKKFEEKLKYYAYTDPMTGVSNRRTGFMVLEEQINNCIRGDNYFSICFIDIDQLRSINDIYGHVEGDNLIKDLVEIIRISIRKDDIISRMGGDEFIIIFPKYRYNEAQRIMHGVFKKVQDFNEMNLKPYKISFSHGIKEINEYTTITNIDEIIKGADKIMYENKTKKTLKKYRFKVKKFKSNKYDI
ncbi:GGDEF domain-containing protein [Clostridium thailandense]|uniref:GGDEF domain-containing protein n=1 Tax=Clostridium thailandense TaxID=2794346 RepID=UPI0039895BAD